MRKPEQAEATSAVVLLVEDEMLIAMMLETTLRGFGWNVVKASRVAAGARLATTEAVDAALLDVNVAGEKVVPVARALRERGIPFVFVTGYGDDGLPSEYDAYPRLRKPFTSDEFENTIAGAFPSLPRRNQTHLADPA